MTAPGSDPGVGADPGPARAPRARASATSQVRGSALLLVGRIVAMGLGLVIQLLLVRLLSKDDYGSFAWALSVVTLVQAVIPLGLDRIDSRFLAMSDEKGDDRSLVGVLIGESSVILVLGAVAFFVVLAWHRHLAPGIAPSDTAANLLVLMVILAPLGALDAMVLNTFATFARPRSVFFRRYLLEPGLRLSAILVVFALGAGVYGLTVGYVAASVVGVALYAVMLVRLLSELGVLAQLHGRVVVPMREMMREGFPLLTSTLVYAATNAMPPLVLGAVGTAVDVAMLRAVQPVATLSLAASSAFAVLYLPMVTRMWVRGERAAIRLSYWRTALWIAIASYPALLLGTAFAWPTTTTLLGERYASSAPLLVVSTIGFWVQSASGFSAQLLSVAGRRWLLLTANVGSLVLGAVASFLLIPAHGAMGAALAMSLTLLGANLFRQLGLMSLPPGFADREVALPYLSMALGLVVCLALQLLLGLGFVAALVVSAVVSLVVGAVSLPYLDVRHTFPELMALPVLGPVLVRLSGPRRRRTTNPYRSAVPPHDPAHQDRPMAAPPRSFATDQPNALGSTGDLSATPLSGGAEPELEALASAAAAAMDSAATSEEHSSDEAFRAAEVIEAHEAQVAPALSASDLALLTPRPASAVVVGPMHWDEIARSVSGLVEGTWVVARLAPTSASLNRTRERAAGLGLARTELFWEAPRRNRRRMVVPLARRAAVLAALERTEGSARGRVLAFGARTLVGMGLLRYVARDRVVVGVKGRS